MIGIGIIFGIIFLEKQITNFNIDADTDKKLYFSILISSLFGFIGAKVFLLVYYQADFNLKNILLSGSTYYGGFLSSIVVFFICNRFLNISSHISINLVTPSLIIAHAFGRLGCFFAGCCFGAPTKTFIGIIYPEGSIPALHLGAHVAVHPVQIYESIFLFSLFYVTYRFVPLIWRVTIYLLSYGAARFFLEFLRGDDRGLLITHSLSPSQIVSIILFLTGVILLFCQLGISKRRELVYFS